LFPSQAAIRQCITDPAATASSVLAACSHELEPHQLSQVLALRGLMAFDLLMHALTKRHLVTMGSTGVLQAEVVCTVHRTCNNYEIHRL
jgi:hypothetical protein